MYIFVKFLIIKHKNTKHISTSEVDVKGTKKQIYIHLVCASSDPVLCWFSAESESAEHDGKIIMEEKVTAES